MCASVAKMEIFRQDLRDEVGRMTSSHAAALEKERLQHKEKKRELEQRFEHTDELKQQIRVSMRRLLLH